MLSTGLSCINASLLLSIGIEKSIILTVPKVKYSVSYRTENTWYRPPLGLSLTALVSCPDPMHVGPLQNLKASNEIAKWRLLE